MEDFYKVLCQQHERNMKAAQNMSPQAAVAFGLQGLEWEHGYYGARQFWGQEWESEDQWEVSISQSYHNRSSNLIEITCL